VDSQPVLFIQGAGSMYEPEGSGRLAAYLARKLGTDYRLIAPEMPDADNPHYRSYNPSPNPAHRNRDWVHDIVGTCLGT
jgi:hypothetical protein